METVITIPASLPHGGKLVLEILDAKAYVGVVGVTDRAPSPEAGITLVWTLPTVDWHDAIYRAIPHLIEYVRVLNGARSLVHDVVSHELGEGL